MEPPFFVIWVVSPRVPRADPLPLTRARCLWRGYLPHKEGEATWEAENGRVWAGPGVFR